MGFYLELFCDSGRDCLGNCEGHQGRTRAEVIASAKAGGWKRIPHKGWFCPECVTAIKHRGVDG